MIAEHYGYPGIEEGKRSAGMDLSPHLPFPPFIPLPPFYFPSLPSLPFPTLLSFPFTIRSSLPALQISIRIYIIIKTTSEFRNVFMTEVGVAGWAWSLHGKQT